MKLITTCILILFSVPVQAGFNLIVPFATKHIANEHVCRGRCNTNDLNEENQGVGFSYSEDNTEIGVIYVDEDSNENHNLYLYYAKSYKWGKDWTFSSALMGTTSYEIVAAPILTWSIKYKILRLTTTYPLAVLAERPHDVANLQLIIPF